MPDTDILNYRIIRLLGTGGMGSVYLAANVNIDQQVAIKVIRPELAKNPRIRAKFRQEAELLCSLDHPGIVKFLNYVETDEGLFLIMEYVKGMTLKDFIEKKNGLIVESKAWPMIKEILEAFSYAHSKGIIHRDIKPSNIMVQEDGHIKIMDFGIAQLLSDEHQGRGDAMGTPAYMSPEQVYGREVDVRSDIYSLGVLMFTMLSGKAPYDSTRLTDQLIKAKVVREELPKMMEYYPHVSDKIQKVVDKATRKSPDERYGDCGEMLKAVKKAIAPDPIPGPLRYGAIAFILICIIGGFLAWDFYRTKYEYYADYVEVWGVPKGIHKLSGNEVRHREHSYKFEKSRGKVRRVTYVNSLGYPIDHHNSEEMDRIVDMTLTYTEGSDKVDTETFMDRSGRVLYVKDFDNNMKTCTFKLNDEFGTEMTLNSQVGLFESAFDAMHDGRSKISKYMLHYDDDGRLLKVEYAGFGNVRVSDGQGLFGKSYKYDEKGRVTEEMYLGKDGKPKTTKFGLGKKLFTYDDDDNLVRTEYRTPEGKPSSDGNNCPVVEHEYDRWGNVISERYYDTEGNPVLRKDDLTAGAVYEYDDNGFLTKYMHLGLDGKVTYSSGVAGQLHEYDERGYLKTVTLIDAAGERAFLDNGGIPFHRVETVNDDHGNSLEILLLNTDLKPVESKEAPRRVMTYDSVGRLTSEFYKDADNNIYAPPALGYAGMKIEYNEQGRLKRLAYLDASKRPVNLPAERFSWFEHDYDSRGNLVEESYFNAEGKPVEGQDGVASLRLEYDDDGNLVSISYFDAKGKPTVKNQSAAKVTYTYDDQGNRVTERFEGTDGRPMIANNYSAGTDYKYDSRGNVTETYPVGLDGRMLASGTRTVYKYDDRDNIVEAAYFDSRGNPKLNEEGIHKEKRQFDGNNNVVRLEYYGTDGRPRNVKGQNYAVRINEYDSRNNHISSTFYDASGSRGSDNLKVHKYYQEYDRVVNKISHQLSFGTDGKPIVAASVAPEGRIEYDRRGNPVCIAAYDGYGKKSTGNRGWSETRMTYDEAGEKTSEAYFSIDGKPVIDTETGYHRQECKYNERRLPESETVFGTDGKPIIGKFGVCTVKYKYDNQNRQTEVAYFGTKGERVDCANGFHRQVFHYRNGAPSTTEVFDKTNRKIATGKMVNNQWSYTMTGGGRTNYSGVGDWRESWREAAASCPMKLDEGLTIQSIRIESSRIQVVMKVALSASDLNEGVDCAQIAGEMGAMLRKSTATPAYVEIQVLIYDKNNQLLN